MGKFVAAPTNFCLAKKEFGEIGVNFTYILQAAFSREESKSPKRH